MDLDDVIILILFAIIAICVGIFFVGAFEAIKEAARAWVLSVVYPQ